MAKHRVMIYHHAGAPSITVEAVSRTTADGEEFEKRGNIDVKSKLVMDKLAELLVLIDGEIGGDGDDPVTAERFAVPAAVEE